MNGVIVRLLTAGIVAGLLGSTLVACGTNCQSSCQKKYNPSECGVQVPGFEDNWSKLFRECTRECEKALTVPGPVGDYNPNERNTTGESVTLQNEKQAALWMDCINETACPRLSEGYCAGP